MCPCISAFREKNKCKEHSSATACLRDSLLSAALNDDDDAAVYTAATGPCSCGVPKLSCDVETHMDVLDKLAACSAAMGKSEAAIGFAAAAIHLDPKSPVVRPYCTFSRTRELTRVSGRVTVGFRNSLEPGLWMEQHCALTLILRSWLWVSSGMAWQTSKLMGVFSILFTRYFSNPRLAVPETGRIRMLTPG